jgi:copper homeostasis protein (lipoprotein)
MIRTTAIAAAALALVLSGCKPAPQPAAKPPALAAAAAPTALEPLLVGVFAGDLPCADCPGMATRLTLVRKDTGWAEGRYLLVQTYRERAVPSLVKTGDWTTLRGDADDPDASVYQLDPDKDAGGELFRKDGEQTLRALTPAMRPFPAGLPGTLTRQTVGLPNEAAVGCLRGGGIPKADGVCARP